MALIPSPHCARGGLFFIDPSGYPTLFLVVKLSRALESDLYQTSNIKCDCLARVSQL
jgi:hypothetical protein